MNINTLEIVLPKVLSDERLDLILLKLDEISKATKSTVVISLEKNELITTAGYAVIMILFDAIAEHQHNASLTGYDPESALHRKLLELVEGMSKGFLPIESTNYLGPTSINIGKVSSVAPEFIKMLEDKFLFILGEENLWDVQLIANELMQNAVDHSTSERYFIYAGLIGSDFGIGVLDRGVSIPSKLEVKYTEDTDEEYLAKSLEIEVGTRRNRKGGMGLYYLFENIKKEGGKLVLISRNAQLRRHFASKNVVKGRTKVPLRGTWCFARIPVGNK